MIREVSYSIFVKIITNNLQGNKNLLIVYDG